jgi:hypothetical protein
LITLFEEQALDYALCGGIAVAFHGYPRFTKDIDILIREEDLDAFKNIVAVNGFLFSSGKMPFGVGTPYKRYIYRISKIESDGILILDLLLLPKYLEDVWDDREFFEWKGKKIQVVSRYGLEKMKRLSGRDQDLLDLKKLGIIEGDEQNDSQ